MSISPRWLRQLSTLAPVICYATQAQFLLGGAAGSGCGQRNSPATPPMPTRSTPLQKLISPAEMGELFKVLVVGKGAAIDQLASLSAVDQCFRL